MTRRERPTSKRFTGSLLAISLAALLMPGDTCWGQRQYPERPRSVIPVYSLGVNVSDNEKRIHRELQEPTTLQFIETPLSDVVLNLSDRYGIPIVLDQRALDGIGIGTDTPITHNLSQIPLRTALDLMLDELELTWTVRDEVLLLTTPEEAQANPQTRIYPLADLMRKPYSADDLEPKSLAPERLIEALRTCLSGERLKTVNITALGGNLIVSCPDQVHFDLEAALYGLRQARARLKDDPAWAISKPIPLSLSSQGDAYKLIEAALAEQTLIEFIETSLSDVMLNLFRRHEIPIVLDTRSLDSIGIGSDTPITQNLKGTSLRSGLNLMLKELELTFVVQDGVLLITTVESAQSRMIPVAYVVSDLAAVRDSIQADYDRVVELITSHVASANWDQGKMSVFERAESLVILQTAEVHQQIAGLLASLREVPEIKEWTPEAQAARLEAYRTTPRLQTFVLFKEGLRIKPDAMRKQLEEFLRANLSAEVLARARGEITNDQFTLHLTPVESADLQRKLIAAELPYVNPRYGSSPRGE